jgi:hypothetical protein
MEIVQRGETARIALERLQQINTIVGAKQAEPRTPRDDERTGEPE